jgi:hypothetical protein
MVAEPHDGITELSSIRNAVVLPAPFGHRT